MSVSPLFTGELWEWMLIGFFRLAWSDELNIDRVVSFLVLLRISIWKSVLRIYIIGEIDVILKIWNLQISDKTFILEESYLSCQILDNQTVCPWMYIVAETRVRNIRKEFNW